MNHWVIMPVVLPILTAVLLLFLRHSLPFQRLASMLSILALLGITIGLVDWAGGGEPAVYRLGDWPAPFGIVLVLDRLSALMVLLVSIVGMLSLAHAIQGWDARGRNFHPLFHFQLMGLNGAFLTGDIFNLFVFFEVLLIASYGLLLYAGGEPARLRAGFKYVVLNLVGSAFFLIAVALLYGITGTLNMADLAVKIPLVGEADASIVQAAGLLLFVVFALKAALVPLQVWLPGTYASAPGPVAALFAVMTKVGAYAILRVYGLAFGPEAGLLADLIAPWLMPAALATLVVGVVGALGAPSLARMTAFLVLGSVGTLLVGFALATPDAVAGGLYYLAHSTVIGAGLFLLVDLIARQRAEVGGRLVADRPMPGGGVLSVLFFAMAIAIVGIPPLSGFLGKLMILQAAGQAIPTAPVAWVWSVILASSLVAMVATSRAGVLVFWGTTKGPSEPGDPPPFLPARRLMPACAAMALLVLMVVFAGPVRGYMAATAAQLDDRSRYIEAVLGPDLARSYLPTGTYYDDHGAGEDHGPAEEAGEAAPSDGSAPAH